MKYKLFLVKYTGKNGLLVSETQVALDADTIRRSFATRGYYHQSIDITELENEVIVYVDIKNVVVH